MQFEDFVIQLGPELEHGYEVRVLQSPRGQGRGLFVPPFKPGQEPTWWAETGHKHRRDVGSPNPAEEVVPSPEEIGGLLFHALFTGEIQRLFDHSLGQVESAKRGLRIQLRIDLSEISWLHDLPWELLYNDQIGTFLGLDDQIQVVRYLAVARPEGDPALPASPSLRILVVAANPDGPGKGALDLERELRYLKEAARKGGGDLVVIQDARRETLAEALAKGSFNVLHFMGHGWYDETTAQGGLCFKAEHGSVQRITGRDLATELQGFRDLHLVFLNACSTARAGGSPTQNPFAGVATALVQAGIPAVVAMRRPISDPAAIDFSRAFYLQLLMGDPIGSAVRRGRLAIHRLNESPTAWAIPVLFLRTPGGIPDRIVPPHPHGVLELQEGAGPTEARVTRPGLLRYLMDQCFPRLHRFLTRIGTFSEPPELRGLESYLTDLASRIENEIGEKTYVPLEARTVPGGPFDTASPQDPFIRPVHLAIRQVLGRADGGDSANAQIAAVNRKSRRVRNLGRALLRSSDPLVLLGDPGSGKTMTLHEVALTLAQKGAQQVFPIVPLYIRLGEFHVTDRVRAEHVLEFVRRFSPASIRPWIDALDREGRLVILFDGMDEMSRDRYNEHTEALSLFAGARQGKIRTLFSCRITDFSPAFLHRRLVLLPLDPAQIARYLHHCLPAPSLEIDGRLWNVSQLARRLAVGNLPVDARNPFVLWLLCFYMVLRRTWPASRLQLIDFFLHQNYELKQKEFAEEGIELPPPDSTFRAWARFAYFITEQNRGSAVARELLLASTDGMADAEQAQAAIRVGTWCGVLVESIQETQRQIGFQHHRFQEYFTAWWIHEQNPSIQWLGKLDAPRWQETMLNLVLMGGARDGVQALATAIGSAADELEAAVEIPTPTASGRSQGEKGQRPRLKTLAEACVTYEQEAVLADRVELGTRLIRGAPNAPGVQEGLRPAVGRALELLVDRGRPITQVKMMRSCQNLEDPELPCILERLLSSPVRWVRDQALILVSAARSGQGLGRTNLAASMGIHLASNQVLPCWPVLARAVAASGSWRLWICLMVTTLFALLDFGLLLAVAWGLYSFSLAGLRTLDGPALGRILAGLKLTSADSLLAAQAALTAAAAVLALRRHPSSAGIWILGSVPAGIALILTVTAMWHGVWESLALSLICAVLLGILGQLLAVLATPPHLAVVASYALITRRFRGVAYPTSALIRIAWRDFEQALKGMVSDLRRAWRLGRTNLLQLALFFLGLLAVLIIPPLLRYWFDIPYLRGLSEGFSLLLVCGILVLVFRLMGTELRMLRSLAVETLLRFVVGAGLGGGLLLFLLHYSKTVAKVSVFIGGLIGLILVLRTLFWLVRLKIAARQVFQMGRFTPEGWMATFGRSGPRGQARLLLSTTPQSVGLRPQEFLLLLIEAEPLVLEDPAHSTYWDRRDELEQALRQERRG